MSAGERLVVGKVRGMHGLRGAVRVESLTDRPEARFAVGSSLYPEGGELRLTVVEATRDGPGWRVRFKEVTSREAAERLRDAYLEAVLGADEELPAGEYYWHQIVGATVRDAEGLALGEVVDVYRAGGGEVMLVRGETGDLDVPLVKTVIRVFEPARGEIVVDREALGLGDAGEGAESADEP